MVPMSGFKIKVEKAEVGHVANAVTKDGQVIESASGFGEKDARRQLKKKMQGMKPIDPNIPRKWKAKPSRKIHNPSGVNFGAKKNIERYKNKRAGKK